MQLYDIYEHPQYGVKAVKQGFSWTAFAAPTVWAAATGLGRLTLILVLASTLMFDVLDLAAQFVREPLAMGSLFLLSYILFGLKPGFLANRWWANYLEEEGWSRKCQVVARNTRHARQAYLDGTIRDMPDLYYANGNG
ncbi:MAG: hypothetical protein R3200_13285 [Xanthomonadales bacterium]|nr:hypothetical protein [Xanthomonadales bacterium]